MIAKERCLNFKNEEVPEHVPSSPGDEHHDMLCYHCLLLLHEGVRCMQATVLTHSTVKLNSSMLDL
jgi:hypothetical protein